MDHKMTIVEAICGGAAGLAGYIAGLHWELLIIWALIVMFDVATGILKGLELQWNSRKFKSGLYLKVYEIILVFTMLLVNEVMLILGISIMGLDINLGYFIIGAFIFADSYSIYENGKALGYGVPTMIRHLIEFTKQYFDNLLSGNKSKE